MSFDWNKKRIVQQLTPNRTIVNLQLSPKEVIAAGGNRIDQNQVIASLCAAVAELMSIQESQAARIESLLQTSKGTADAVGEPVSEEPGGTQ